MRAAFVAVALAMAVLAVPGSAAAAEDVPNTTCRLDAAVARAALDAEVTCLQLDTETWGEFDASVTVTLQRRAGGQWTDVAEDTCAGRSQEGVLSLNCSAVAPGEAGNVLRGLIDLDAPKDWPAAVADPVYQGGAPISEPLAEDQCDVGEAAEPYDLTLPDSPWTDLCAVTMESVVAESGGLESVDVVTHVTGLLEDRVPTGTWVTSFRAGNDCRHEITVTDSGGAGEASARVHSGCGEIVGECTGTIRTISDLLGMTCATVGDWEYEEEFELAEDAVTLEGAEVRVALRPDEVGALLARDLAVGTTLGGVSARTYTGVGSGADGAQGVVVDGDAAHSTGRTYSVGD